MGGSARRVLREVLVRVSVPCPSENVTSLFVDSFVTSCFLAETHHTWWSCPRTVPGGAGLVGPVVVAVRLDNRTLRTSCGSISLPGMKSPAAVAVTFAERGTGACNMVRVPSSLRSFPRPVPKMSHPLRTLGAAT